MSLSYLRNMGSVLLDSYIGAPVFISISSALQLTGSFFPRLVSGIKNDNVNNDNKMDKINDIIKRTLDELGMEKIQVNLIAAKELGENAGMLGVRSALGGPILCLGSDFITSFGMHDDHPDYQRWRRVLDEIPNDPEKIGTFLDECTDEKRNEIKDLGKRFSSSLSEAEFESVIAHELSHANHYHNLKVQIYETALSYTCVYLIQGVAGLTFGFFGAAVLSRSHEKQADAEGPQRVRYRAGMRDLHKRNLLKQILEKPRHRVETDPKLYSYRIKNIDIADYFSTHPHSVSRLRRAIQLPDPNTRSNIKMIAVASASLLLLANLFVNLTLRMNRF